jgi:hypothetical protein
MAANVTYLFGAGASYNALPLVTSFRNRFEVFCGHLLHYYKNKINDTELAEMKIQQNKILENIKIHYTVDTYAKKLFLKKPQLYTNQDYVLLTNYLSAYFIYEQLSIDINKPCNEYLKDKLIPVVGDATKRETETVYGILKNLDYRYDSFFASILKHDEQGALIVPKNINFISWNYDFQIEKAFMNFNDCSLTYAIEALNVFATPQDIWERPFTDSHLIKLNGTAGFLQNKKFGELFDFSEHTLDDSYFSLCKEIFLKRMNKAQNALRFSWEESKLRSLAIEMADKKINNSDIVVIIGYSFPYFNREVDRLIFNSARNGKNLKVYIQSPSDTVNSVIARFKAIAPSITPEPFTETDQFLIPNEL